MITHGLVVPHTQVLAQQAHNAEYADPDFGLPLKRISAATLGKAQVNPEYPRVPAWNADQTFLMLAGGGGGSGVAQANFHIVDPANPSTILHTLDFQTGFSANHKGMMPIWDPVNPRRIHAYLHMHENDQPTGNTTSGSNVITSVSSTTGFAVNDKIHVFNPADDTTNFVGTIASIVGSTITLGVGENVPFTRTGAILKFSDKTIVYDLTGTGLSITGRTITIVRHWDEYAAIDKLSPVQLAGWQALSKDGRYRAVWARKTGHTWFDNPERHEIFPYDVIAGAADSGNNGAAGKGTIMSVFHHTSTDPGGSNDGQANCVDSVEWIQMSPSGTYLVVGFSKLAYLGAGWSQGTGVIVYNRSTGLIAGKLAGGTAHGDLIQDANGTEYFVMDNSSGPIEVSAHIVRAVLPDAMVWSGTPYTTNAANLSAMYSQGKYQRLMAQNNQNLHVSCQAFNISGSAKYCLVSTYGASKPHYVSSVNTTTRVVTFVDPADITVGPSRDYDFIIPDTTTARGAARRTAATPANFYGTVSSVSGLVVTFNAGTIPSWWAANHKVAFFRSDNLVQRTISGTISSVNQGANTVTFVTGTVLTGVVSTDRGYGNAVQFDAALDLSDIVAGDVAYPRKSDDNSVTRSLLNGELIKVYLDSKEGALAEYGIADVPHYERLCKTRTVANDYYQQAHAVLSPKGDYALFGSNFANLVQTVDAYVVDLDWYGHIPLQTWKKGPAITKTFANGGHTLDSRDGWTAAVEYEPSARINDALIAQGMSSTVSGGDPTTNEEGYANDTWSFSLDKNKWTNIVQSDFNTHEPPGPGAAPYPWPAWYSTEVKPWVGHPYTSFKAESFRNRAWLIGTQSAKPSRTLNSTWLFDPASNIWSKILAGQPSTSIGGAINNSPTGEVFAPAIGEASEFPKGFRESNCVYIPLTDQLWKYGGEPSDRGGTAPFKTYLMDLAGPSQHVWVEVVTGANPGRRCASASFWDKNRKRVWIWGGAGSFAIGAPGNAKNDLWYFDMDSASPNFKNWVGPVTQTNTPSARGETAYGYAPTADVFIMAAGSNTGDGNISPLTETWLLNMATMTWTQLAASPNIIRSSNGAYFSKRGVFAAIEFLASSNPVWFMRLESASSESTDPFVGQLVKVVVG